jgi:hypothetical protein
MGNGSGNHKKHPAMTGRADLLVTGCRLHVAGVVDVRNGYQTVDPGAVVARGLSQGIGKHRHVDRHACIKAEAVDGAPSSVNAQPSRARRSRDRDLKPCGAQGSWMKPISLPSASAVR